MVSLVWTDKCVILISLCNNTDRLFRSFFSFNTATNGEGKFGMQGYYELAGQWEEVWTYEETDGNTIWSYSDPDTNKYVNNEEYQILLIGKFRSTLRCLIVIA